jgi:hypothetical protein
LGDDNDFMPTKEAGTTRCRQCVACAKAKLKGSDDEMGLEEVLLLACVPHRGKSGKS